ncbi:MAG: hypothetical protein ACP5OC_08140, partial [Thermoplasmata archaeon]
LPPGSQIYLYGFQTGGQYFTSNFNYGEIPISSDPIGAGGYIYNGLALTTSDYNNYTTTCNAYVIAGVGVSGYTAMGYNYSVSGKSLNFTVNSLSLVIVVQDGGNTTSPGTGIPGLSVATKAVGINGWAAISISYSNLTAGNYDFIPNGGSVTGVFIFSEESTTGPGGVVFSESGLQSGDQWAVTLLSSSGYETYTSIPTGLPPSNSSIVIRNLATGEYSYTIGMANNNGGTSQPVIENVTTGYVITPSEGNFYFSGSGISIIVKFIPLAFYNTLPIGGNYTDLNVSSNSYLDSNLLVRGNMVISSSVTLYTNGFSIIVSGSFINDGTIVTGWPYNGGNSTNPTPVSLPESYGGSGGGSDTHDSFTVPGGNGGSTLASGGGTVFANYAGNGNTPSPPSLNNSVILNMYDQGMQNFLTGAGGGFAYGWGALNGGSGAYGAYIQANQILAGNIDAFGLQDGNISDMQNGGSGGGGVIILAYGPGGYTPGTYNVSGGVSTDEEMGSASG